MGARTSADRPAAPRRRRRDRAAAGAECGVDHRQLDRDARDHGLGRRARLAAEHRAAWPCRTWPTSVAAARGPRRPPRPGPRARSRPLLGRGADVEHPARGLGRRRRHAGLLRARRQALEVGPELRREVTRQQPCREKRSLLRDPAAPLARERDVDAVDASRSASPTQHWWSGAGTQRQAGATASTSASLTLNDMPRRAARSSPSRPMRSRTVKRSSLAARAGSGGARRGH